MEGLGPREGSLQGGGLLIGGGPVRGVPLTRDCFPIEMSEILYWKLIPCGLPAFLEIPGPRGSR